jgi:hypothetical protein
LDMNRGGGAKPQRQLNVAWDRKQRAALRWHCREPRALYLGARGKLFA